MVKKMNQYYELLKQEVIVFEKLLIDKYHLIGLNELETIILIKINKSLKEGKRKLVVEEIAPNMSVDSSTVANVIIDLVNRGYINVELSSVDAKETYNLEGTMKRLSEVFEENNIKSINLDENISRIINTYETETGKSITSLELEMVRHWFNDLNYSLEQVEDAMFKANKNKKLSIKYCDRILANENKKVQHNQDDGEILDLISKMYAKK